MMPPVGAVEPWPVTVPVMVTLVVGEMLPVMVAAVVDTLPPVCPSICTEPLAEVLA